MPRILREVALEIEQDLCLKEREEVVGRVGKGFGMVWAVLDRYLYALLWAWEGT